MRTSPRAAPASAAAPAALAALGLLAACAGTPTVLPPTVGPAYGPEIINYSAGKGGMLTEVVGNPFQAPKAELEAAVVEAAEGSHFGQRIPFVLRPPAGYNSPYRVVYAMNPVPGTNPRDLCGGEAQTRQRLPSESDRVSAALCAGDSVISSVRGSVAGPTGPRDPAFRSLIAQLTLAMFPPESPERRDGRGIFDLN